MTRGKPAAKAVAKTAGIAYRVEIADLHAHLFRVPLTIAKPAAQQQVQLPAWSPGSYLVREFAKNLQNLTARPARRSIAIDQLTNASWQVNSNADAPLEVQYAVYAFDNSVRTAWLDATRGFFNGTSLCLMVEGQQDQPHTLELLPCAAMPQWKVATGLPAVRPDKRGFGTYAATDYDMLVDCPFELGDFWVGKFDACGIPHQFVVAGAPPSFDGAQLLKDTQAICEAEIRFWHGDSYQKNNGSCTKDGGYSPILFKNYVFMLNAVNDGYGGLSTATPPHSSAPAKTCRANRAPRWHPRCISSPRATPRCWG
jgi:predicted metalloprotease with PDZ domain